MTEHRTSPEPEPDPSPAAVVELERVDRWASGAAQGLHAHVRSHLDVDAAAASIGSVRTGRRAPRPPARFVAVAAAIALVVGVVAVSSSSNDDGRDRVDADLSVPELTPGLLRPLGPRDGKDSVKLPLTAEPSTGLHDGDTVTAQASGFVPGEAVGLVQCAREAGGDSPETRGGADGCYISQFTNITADDQGVATGTYKVRRILTTPLTGTVDCAAEAGRCMVAMGAISDYDRSGGHPIEFATDVAPVALPTASVTPAEELADGQVVHVVADGLEPGSALSAEVCSSDPLACWATGDGLTLASGSQPSATSTTVGGGDRYGVFELTADERGHLEADLPVWRFLPGPDAGTYVDCAVSRCSLRLYGSTAPPTLPLHFRGDEPAPTAPSFGMDRSSGLAPGDEVTLAGEGFEPGHPLWVSICVVPADPAQYGGEGYLTCGGSMAEPIRPDGSGAFAVAFLIPDPGSMGRTEQCDENGCTVIDGDEIRCDDVAFRCELTVDVERDGPMARPPVFRAVPIPITFREVSAGDGDQTPAISG